MAPVWALDLRAVAAAPIIAGPWPSYASFANLPERERWVLYGSAKAYREALEGQGFVMSENYDDFVRRVCQELDL
ncbi:hypothetical protein AB4P95_20185 [Pseudomonas sp. A1437]|uniref:hypothetical protein n=1 Tax=unclassified Pseudomonas TaxID=196821 RepID=UPI003784F829